MTDAPFQFFSMRVLRTTRPTPSFVRVTFGGDDIARMATAGRDQRVKLFLPRPGQDAPVLPGPDDGHWWDAWRALDPAVRGVMRTYTVRELRREPQELDVDFAVHELPPGSEEGPATRWALNAAPGARIGILAPLHDENAENAGFEENAGYDFRPPADTDWILLTGDESALPAVAGILESLPAGLPARVWIALHHAADRWELPTKADAHVTWLVREESAPTTEDAIRAADDLPAGTPYAWIAGESATVKAVRRHLVGDRGIDRKAVKFTGYWRRGTSEDELLRSGEDA